MILILHKYVLCWVRQDLWLSEVFLIASPSSPKKSLAAFHKPIFSFSVNTLGCAHSPLTRRWILCSHFLSLLFLSYSHSRARAGSHPHHLQKTIHCARLIQLLAEIGWQRTKVAQTKQKSTMKSYSSPLYLTLSSHRILITSKLCESLWNTNKHKNSWAVLGGEVHILMLGFLWNIYF